MSIWCWGRRYPNAPLQYYTGAQRRLPGHWWHWNGIDFTGAAAVFNGVHLLGPASSFLLKQTNPDNNWLKEIPDPNFEFGAGVSIRWTGTTFWMRCTAGAQQITGPPTNWWVDFNVFSTTGWDWGTSGRFQPAGDFTAWRADWGMNARVAFRIAQYSDLPANSCTGV